MWHDIDQHQNDSKMIAVGRQHLVDSVYHWFSRTYNLHLLLTFTLFLLVFLIFSYFFLFFLIFVDFIWFHLISFISFIHFNLFWLNFSFLFISFPCLASYWLTYIVFLRVGWFLPSHFVFTFIHLHCVVLVKQDKFNLMINLN